MILDKKHIMMKNNNNLTKSFSFLQMTSMGQAREMHVFCANVICVLCSVHLHTLISIPDFSLHHHERLCFPSYLVLSTHGWMMLDDHRPGRISMRHKPRAVWTTIPVLYDVQVTFIITCNMLILYYPFLPTNLEPIFTGPQAK